MFIALKKCIDTKKNRKIQIEFFDVELNTHNFRLETDMRSKLV